MTVLSTGGSRCFRNLDISHSRLILSLTLCFFDRVIKTFVVERVHGWKTVGKTYQDPVFTVSLEKTVALAAVIELQEQFVVKYTSEAAVDAAERSSSSAL